MDTPRPLAERSLEALLEEAVLTRREGLVVLRDRDGLRHGVWVQAGFVVGLHVAGRFDPLLDLLRKHGALSVHAYRACVQALWRSPARSGAIATEVAGVERPLVRDALKAQARDRMAALLEIAQQRGHDAWFEAGEVPVAELNVRMPLGALLRGTPQPPPYPQAARPPQTESERAEARRRLRQLAKRLHPDRHAHLDAEARKRLERALAEATAAYHGLA